MPTIIDSTVINQSYNLEGNGGRKLVKLSNKWLIAGVRNNTANVQLYKSTDFGQTWTHLVTISSSVYDFSLVSRGTDIYVIIVFDSAVTAYKVNAITSEVSNQMVIDSGLVFTNRCSAVINEQGTEIHVAWAAKSASHPYSMNIRYTKGTIDTSGAVSWGTVEQITTANASGYSDGVRDPSIILYNNIPLIVASSQVNFYSQGTQYISISGISIFKRDSTLPHKGTNGAVNIYWSASTIHIPSTSFSAVLPSICTDNNGRIWIAWQGKEPGYTNNDNIYSTYSDDGGITWSSIKYVTTSDSTNPYFHYQSPSITVNKNNELFIVCYGGRTNEWNLMYLKYDGTNIQWPQTIIKEANGEPNQKMYPTTLIDPTLDFSVPLLIYQDKNKVGFYGTWHEIDISVEPGYIGKKISDDKNNILQYSITSADPITQIIEKLNGTVIATRNNPSNGQQFTVSLSQSQWDELQYGDSHVLTIEVNGYIWKYTFDKRLNSNEELKNVIKSIQDLQSHFANIKSLFIKDFNTKGASLSEDATFQDVLNSLESINFKRFASGEGTTDSNARLTVTGLNFKPRYIMIMGVDVSARIMAIYNSDISTTYAYHATVSDYSAQQMFAGYGSYVDETGFKIAVGGVSYAKNKVVKWVAIA